MAFDENMAEDVREVLDTAAVLEITEFQVFRMAYARWYGDVPSERTVEPFFIKYMFDDVVPPWVRRFTRYVLDLSRQGRLDPVELGIERFIPSMKMYTRGKRYLLALVVILTTMIVVAEFVATMMERITCITPPCY